MFVEVSQVSIVLNLQIIIYFFKQAFMECQEVDPSFFLWEILTKKINTKSIKNAKSIKFHLLFNTLHATFS